MGAPFCIVFWGLKIQEVNSPEELEIADENYNRLRREYKRLGIDYIWSGSGSTGVFYRFIGKEICIMGPEWNSGSFSCSKEEFLKVTEDIRKKLEMLGKEKIKELGFKGEPSLHVYWEED